MAIQRTILEARNRGANDKQILGEIIKNNPNKAQTFNQAITRGAQPNQVLDEVIKQNPASGGERFGARLLGKNVNTGRRKEGVAGVGGAIAETGLNVGIGAVKGGLTTATQVPKKVTQIAETRGTIAQAKSGAKGIKELQDISNRLVKADIDLGQDDPRKQQIRDANKEVQEQINLVSRGLPTTNTPLTDKAFESLKARGRAQQAGFALEQVAEFVVGGRAVDKTLKAGLSGGLGRARGLGQLNKTEETIETILSPLAKLNKARGAKDLNKLGELTTSIGNIVSRGAGNAVIDGIIAGGQDRDVKQAAITGGIFSGAFGVFDELRQFSGSLLNRSAEKLYQSALKPPGKLGVEGQKAVVRTGLQEGIVLSESGIRKTAGVIDDLESQLGKAIDSAPPGTVIKVKELKPFVDSAKKVLANTTDVAQSRKAKKAIDDIWRAFKRKHGRSIDVAAAQELKVNTYKWLRESYDKLATPVKEANKQLARGLKEGILEAVPTVGELNPRLKSLYTFDDALEKSAARLGNLNLLGLGSKVLGGGLRGKLGGAAAFVNQFLGAPGSKSFGAIKLNKLANIIKGLDRGTAQQLLGLLSETVRADVTRRLSR